MRRQPPLVADDEPHVTAAGLIQSPGPHLRKTIPGHRPSAATITGAPGVVKAGRAS